MAGLDDKQQIAALVQRINDAWLKGPAEDIAATLNDCFDDRMLIKGPGMVTLSEGKQASIRSYTEFLQQAKVRDCTLANPEVHVVGDAAVATYGWTMTYELNRQEYTESGFDVFAFSRIDGAWKAIWRALLPGVTG